MTFFLYILDPFVSVVLFFWFARELFAKIYTKKFFFSVTVTVLARIQLAHKRIEFFLLLFECICVSQLLDIVEIAEVY